MNQEDYLQKTKKDILIILRSNNPEDIKVQLIHLTILKARDELPYGLTATQRGEISLGLSRLEEKYIDIRYQMLR